MLDQLQSLADKLEGLSGADRETDWHIADAFQLPEPWPHSTLWPPFVEGSRFDKRIPTYTASLDATVALVEQVLPGWAWAVMSASPNEDKPWAGLARSRGAMTGFGETAPTAPLALLRALVSAKIEEERASISTTLGGS